MWSGHLKTSDTDRIGAWYAKVEAVCVCFSMLWYPALQCPELDSGPFVFASFA